MRVLFLLLLLVSGGSAFANEVDLLDRPARVFIGDDPAFASAEFDDSAWQEQPVYLRGSWQARGVTFDDEWYWMRIAIDGAELQNISNPAIRFGKIKFAVAFFNGIEIGRTGIMTKPIGGHRTIYNKAIPQVYDIPKDAINSEGPNTLALKVASGGFEVTGIIQGPVSVTDEISARDNARAETVLLVILGSISPLVHLFGLFVSGATWAFAPRHSGLGWLFLSFVVFTPLTWATSIPAAVLDLAIPSLVYPVATLMLAVCVLVPMLEFAAVILKAHRGWLLRLFQASILAVVFFPDFEADILFTTSLLSAELWLTQCLLTFVIISFWAVRAALHGQRPAISIAFGATAVWLSIALIFAGAEEWFYRNTGAGAGEFLVPIFLISLGWAGMQSLLEAQGRLAEVQADVLRVQEAERRRVAYDIHDGVGQWLSTIKLGLQMLQGQQRGNASKESFSEVVRHVDEAISDTRRIAHDLSPAMIEKKGLVAAMESHADYMSGKADVRVNAHGMAFEQLSVTTQGHLYRIFQEMLQNAIKHGQATQITASLAYNRNEFFMTIQDNGIGFDNGAATPGLGISSMTQRAALIGAEVSVQSNKGTGTKITVHARNLIA